MAKLRPVATQLVTPPAAEVLSLAEAKSHLGVVVSADDADITAYTKAARQYLEQQLTRRALVQQTWDAWWPRFPEAGRRLYLPLPPCVSVGAVEYVDGDGATQAWTDYEAVLPGGDAPPPAYLVPAYGFTWPVPRAMELAVRVRFTCGYGATGADVPEPLRHALRLLVGSWNENRSEEELGTIAVRLGTGLATLTTPYRVLEV